MLPICYISRKAQSCSAGGNALELEVGLSGLNGAGFFMKPFFPWHNDSSMQEWPLLALTGLQYVTATYGPFGKRLNPGFNFLRGSSRYPTTRLLGQECNWRIYRSLENWRRRRDSNPR